MNAGELHRLARHLRELAVQTTTQPDEPPPSPGLIAVMEDLARWPESSIGETVKRVGLAQSFVSRLVAELRDEGLLTTRPDPEDRRRVRVSLAPGVREDVLMPRARRPLTDTLARQHPGLSLAEVHHAEHLLTELAALLQTSA